TETVTSPTLAHQIRTILKRYPQARWHQYEPAGAHSARAAAIQAFARPVQAIYRFDRAQRILSLDSDFLLSDPGSLAYARQFINARRLRKSSESGGPYRE